jgi:hypothetical protein
MTSQNGKKQTIHVNRLKPAHDPTVWNPKFEQKVSQKPCKQPDTIHEEDGGDDEIKTRHFLLLSEMPLEARTPPSQVPDTPDSTPRTTDTSHSERRDPSYELPGTPRSRRELRTVRPEPPWTRSRTRFHTLYPSVAETVKNTD